MVLAGKGVSGGIAIGKLSVYNKNTDHIKRLAAKDTDAELVRFENARKQAGEALGILYGNAAETVGEENAAIFEVHALMLEDEDFVIEVKNIIETEKVNAEYAVLTAGNNIAEKFSAMDDDYMKERAADIKDVCSRVISILTGREDEIISRDESVIILADELAPSETVQLDKSKILSFVTRFGSANSHTAILARTMNIPALTGVDFDKSVNGKTGIVDGFSGKLIIDPDKKTLEEYRRKKEEEELKEIRLNGLKGKETITGDGRKINLYANISGVKDIDAVFQNDAEGIGLLRSEFLYLESRDYPEEETLFNAYRTIAESMKGKRVIIRTLDIGADKQADYFNLAEEENPAMGYRAIRICLTRPEIFKTELRAIYRASAYGKIAIMFPMIISLEEIKQIKEIISEVKAGLDSEGILYGDVELGIMIETPAAVMISDILAGEVDFFSVGTNDLTQYTLAIDRQNPKLDSFYDSHHEAVMRMLKTVVDNGHKGGCWVGICGELGADLSLTGTFIEMGFDEISVTPSMILKVREAVRNYGTGAAK